MDRSRIVDDVTKGEREGSDASDCKTSGSLASSSPPPRQSSSSADTTWDPLSRYTLGRPRKEKELGEKKGLRADGFEGEKGERWEMEENFETLIESQSFVEQGKEDPPEDVEIGRSEEEKEEEEGWRKDNAERLRISNLLSHNDADFLPYFELDIAAISNGISSNVSEPSSPSSVASPTSSSKFSSETASLDQHDSVRRKRNRGEFLHRRLAEIAKPFVTFSYLSSSDPAPFPPGSESKAEIQEEEKEEEPDLIGVNPFTASALSAFAGALNRTTELIKKRQSETNAGLVVASNSRETDSEKKRKRDEKETTKLTATESKRLRNNEATACGPCAMCGKAETSEWRRGISGKRDLCNGCGLFVYKQMKKSQQKMWRWDSME